MSPSPRVQKLLALIDLVNTAAQTVVQEWTKEDLQAQPERKTEDSIPSLQLYDAQRTIIGSCGGLSELLLHPEHLISEVALGFFQSRALHVAAENHIADILATAEHGSGMSIKEIGARAALDPHKLGRIMRSLCSVHIFQEVEDGCFANNRVDSQNLRVTLLICDDYSFRASPVYAASKELPSFLQDSANGGTASPSHTALSQSIGRPVTFWDWLEERTSQPDGSLKPNPMLDVMSLAMVSGGRIFTAPLYHDFPWESLSSATVVDVGGGVGGMSLDLAKMYPNLKFIIQDRPQVLEKAAYLWTKEYPESLESRRVTMMPHDFFEANPIKGADVYLFRHILHDWDDAQCEQILASIKSSMSPTSRILIADQVMNTTVGYPELASAPAPLPANYGVWNRLADALDIDMMAMFNGVERTPAEFRGLAIRAGLVVTRVWECKGFVQIVELRLP